MRALPAAPGNYGAGGSYDPYRYNDLYGAAKESLRAAAGDRVELEL